MHTTSTGFICPLVDPRFTIFLRSLPHCSCWNDPAERIEEIRPDCAELQRRNGNTLGDHWTNWNRNLTVIMSQIFAIGEFYITNNTFTHFRFENSTFFYPNLLMNMRADIFFLQNHFFLLHDTNFMWSKCATCFFDWGKSRFFEIWRQLTHVALWSARREPRIQILWSLWVSIDWAWKEESNELPKYNLSPFYR